MQTTEIKEFKTVCKGSKAIALNLLNLSNANVKKAVSSNLKYVGKAVAYYNQDNIQVAYLNAERGKLLLVVPRFSPIYK